MYLVNVACCALRDEWCVPCVLPCARIQTRTKSGYRRNLALEKESVAPYKVISCVRRATRRSIVLVDHSTTITVWLFFTIFSTALLKHHLSQSRDARTMYGCFFELFIPFSTAQKNKKTSFAPPHSTATHHPATPWHLHCWI